MNKVVTKSLDLDEKMFYQILFDTHQAVFQIWLGFARQGPTRQNTTVDFQNLSAKSTAVPQKLK